MEARMLEIKMAVAAFLMAIGTLLGWRGIMALFWVAVMALDYASGTMAARKNNEWDSKVAREGIRHKVGMAYVVAVALIFDALLWVVSTQIPVLQFTWPVMFFPLVVAWYIITELGSILENAVKLGANVPDWLVKGLKVTLKSVDQAGHNTIKEDNDK